MAFEKLDTEDLKYFDTLWTAALKGPFLNEKRVHEP
jgi:hypothetical protein